MFLYLIAPPPDTKQKQPCALRMLNINLLSRLLHFCNNHHCDRCFSSTTYTRGGSSGTAEERLVTCGGVVATYYVCPDATTTKKLLCTASSCKNECREKESFSSACASPSSFEIVRLMDMMSVPCSAYDFPHYI